LWFIVFVRKGKDKKAQIVLLDHGLYEHVPEKTRQTLCNFWESMVLRNDNSLKTFANDLNVEGKSTVNIYYYMKEIIFLKSLKIL